QGRLSAVDHAATGDDGQRCSSTKLDTAYFNRISRHAWSIYRSDSGARNLNSRDFSQCLTVLRRSFDESFEQWMAIHRAGFELRMELASEKPGMIFKLDDLNQVSIRRYAARNHSFCG